MISLQAAIDKAGSDFVKEELEGLTEFAWPISQRLVHIEEMAEEVGDKKTLLSIHRIFVLIGRAVELPASEYENCAVLGARKNQVYPLLDGKRWKYLTTDSEFEAAHP